SRSPGRATPISTDRWMPASRGCGDMEPMKGRRVQVPPLTPGDSPPASVAACPPIGPGGRWAAVAHALFYGTLAIGTTMALARPSPGLARVALEIGLVALLAAWYSYWIVRCGQDVMRSNRLGALYFGLGALMWTALLGLDPAYEFLSFTAFAQVLGYL